MNKDKLKNLFDDYWYDDQFFKQKVKDFQSVEKLFDHNKTTLYQSAREHEELELKKIIEKKQLVECLISKLPQPYRTILYMKYISFLTFDQIAYKMNYSTKRIYQLHGEALTKLTNIINNDNQLLAKISKV